MMKVLFLYLVDTDISDEDGYYLELNEETANGTSCTKWHHLSIRTFTSDQGEKHYTFAEAKEAKPAIYEKALEFVKLRVFDKPWEGTL